MSVTVALATALVALVSTVVLAAALFVLRRRWSAERDELARLSYERALGADQRLDFVDARLDRLERRARVDGLFGLLATAESSGRLDAVRARRLEAVVLALRDEVTARSPR